MVGSIAIVLVIELLNRMSDCSCLIHNQKKCSYIETNYGVPLQFFCQVYNYE